MSDRGIERVTVYCASSRSCDARYFDAAHRLGARLAAAGLETVYGGGRKGSMGALADGALASGGSVVGVLPKFMLELEWGHEGLSRLELVDDMRVRKERMLKLADAVVALPGGSGTFEELFEALSMKRLGFFLGPIVLVDTGGFFAPCIELLERTIEERFMGEHHAAMWQVVSEPEEVLDAFAKAAPWSRDAQRSAGV